MATATTIDPRSAHLRAQALACARGERLLFEGLNLAVMPGQAIWVKGPNGKGKTSLLRLLAGLSKPAAGEVHAFTPRVYLGHQHALKDDLTSLESLAFLVQLHGGSGVENDLITALDTLGVKAKRRALVRTLSQGQRRRVALARLPLSASPSVWILDEPFDALDTHGIDTLNGLIQGHRQAGGAVVLTSHQAVTLPELAVLDLSGLAAR